MLWPGFRYASWLLCQVMMPIPQTLAELRMRNIPSTNARTKFVVLTEEGVSVGKQRRLGALGVVDGARPSVRFRWLMDQLLDLCFGSDADTK